MDRSRRARRTGVAVASGLGFPITQALVARFGRAGAAATEGIAGALLARDLYLFTRRGRDAAGAVPTVLLGFELGAAAAATIAGLPVLVRPERARFKGLPDAAETFRRVAVGTMFGLHSWRTGADISRQQA